MSQYAEQTQTLFAELQASHERIKTLTASMEEIFKTLQEQHAQLSKAAEETNKRLNQVFEEQHHRKRDMDFLDQDINKLFDFYHNMKPQPKAHFMNNPYHQEDIKPYSLLENKEISPSQCQDEDNMYFSAKKNLKQIPEASSWPKFSGTGEYDLMGLIDYIDGLFIDVPSIPDYWLTHRINTEFKGHANEESQTPDPNSRRARACSDNTLQDIWKRTNIGKYSPYKKSGFKERQPFRVEIKEKPRERVAEVTKKKNSCDNCGSTDHYANNCPKEKKKVYTIEKVPEEESPTEDS
ncbi:hypothetical protein O181_039476 [Austropuccinia psidii MF-1]|uniref:CCHC-type domain-containing protein n=1 Tax=Austropuccinia psidii MF-1 TaxID=1389203 RepID=A0A9Q3DG06_9BASI|nr:hypothetical protein [Austropuccinia psidii MF-1]